MYFKMEEGKYSLSHTLVIDFEFADQIVNIRGPYDALQWLPVLLRHFQAVPQQHQELLIQTWSKKSPTRLPAREDKCN